MKQLYHIEEYRFWRSEQGEIAFVPTMGNLHEGHLSLVKKAQEYADTVVVSVFINPLQFSANEDLNNYPKTLAEDLEKLSNLNVSAVFIPNVAEMYPKGEQAQTQVMVPNVSRALCGASRPHFFQGVATVVCKLFNIIKPNYAIFGEKDFQQLLVVKKMVHDLNMPIDVIGAPIVREDDGLAMSSRNGYLSDTSKTKASLIHQILQNSAQQLRDKMSLADVIKKGIDKLNQNDFKVDYFELCDEADLNALDEFNAPARLFVAAELEHTRLIDNLKVVPF